MDFIFQNMGTILVALGLAAIISLITIKMSRDKRKGKTSCGCGCDSCPSAGLCHKIK